MGKLTGLFWDSPKAQFDTIFGLDMKRKNRPFKNLAGKGKNLSKEAKKAYLAREKAKGTESLAYPEGTAITNTPLTDRYS